MIKQGRTGYFIQMQKLRKEKKSFHDGNRAMSGITETATAKGLLLTIAALRQIQTQIQNRVRRQRGSRW